MTIVMINTSDLGNLAAAGRRQEEEEEEEEGLGGGGMEVQRAVDY